MWYEFFKYALFAPGVRALWHPHVIGAENIPAEGGAILACNHIAAVDPVVVAAMIDRKLTYPAKKELFAGDRGLWSKVVAWFLRAIDQVPLDRSGGRTSLAAIGSVEDRLAEGGLVGIFPEGTRSPDGRLYKGKTGVARMALGSGTPVVPMGISGTTVKRKILGVPVLDHPTIVFGKPMHFDVLAGRSSEIAVLRWVTDEVMGAISDLTGQEYVDVYGFRVKHGDLKGKDVSTFVKTRPGGKPVPPPAVTKV
ncbi:1-acyl-sn-glycerol-3-phosphate acyltransferase [Cutibacterium sp.]|uniref:lysophospholipid acyltransferase family protein n=1 Tax=Cutibacterium sp. TaxID=1912221 RepID=UPI0026DB8383|nr:lysophospholipid acyltransferase family protein [Cutibacterium sp.]MDO4411612.1 lysophospholipid acyltransferase family protein [Cutibacterium sp.]